MKKCNKPEKAEICDCCINICRWGWVCDEEYGYCEHQGEEIIEDAKT